MANDYFQFKQFKVSQARAAMKVCTDACVLGAIAGEGHPQRILDIGTGTGLLSLMLAQRFPEAQVEAVEIDRPAYGQAAENFIQSPWADRLCAVHADILGYTPSQLFDLIVCNPPFFQDHLKASESGRNIALHNDLLPFGSLAEAVKQNLHPQGDFYVMLPPYQSGLLEAEMQKQELHPFKKYHLYQSEASGVFRVISAYASGKEVQAEEHLRIKEGQAYSARFRELLGDFYLHL